MEEHLMRLQHFLATAPTTFSHSDICKRFNLPVGNGNEYISCIYWKGNFFITGTDIVKILSFRFMVIGRNILNQKKFEEGIFSDLRNLKPGVDSVLEEARSEFLELLYKNGCVRTQKKQKVFFWYSVPHEVLFKDALDRDVKRETMVNGGTSAGSFHHLHHANGIMMQPHHLLHLNSTANNAAFQPQPHLHNLPIGAGSVGMMMPPSKIMGDTMMMMPNISSVAGVGNPVVGGEYFLPNCTIDPLNHVNMQAFTQQYSSENNCQNALEVSIGGNPLTSTTNSLMSNSSCTNEQMNIVFDDPAFQELFDHVFSTK